MRWIEQVQAVPLAEVAEVVGLEQVQGRSWTPCLSCDAERRGRSDTRGPIGFRPDELGWRCHRCGVGGDGVALFFTELGAVNTVANRAILLPTRNQRGAAQILSKAEAKRDFVQRVVRSAGEPASEAGNVTRGTRKLQRRLGDPEAVGAFEGLDFTVSGTATSLTHRILMQGNRANTFTGELVLAGFRGERGIVVFDCKGRGVVATREGVFITFVEQPRGLEPAVMRYVRRGSK